MTQTKSSGFLKNGVLQGIVGAGLIIPVAIALGVCSPFGISAAFFISIVCTALHCFGVEPSLYGFLIAGSVAMKFGTFPACLCITLSCLLFAVYSLIASRRKINIDFGTISPCTAALTLGLAFLMTVMQTTNYFGIGAVGNSATEMLTSYRSLGFHANWRGVLYGTITLVFMITWRRKFKKLNKSLAAPLVSVIFTTVLNFFLNPVKMHTAINELGDVPLISEITRLTPLFNADVAEFSVSSAVAVLVSALALSFILISDSIKIETDTLIPTVANGVLSPFGILPLTGGTKPKCETANSIACGITGVLLTLAVFLVPPCREFLSRIPIHSLAVILIVSLWQKVDWHSLKVTFTGGIIPIIVLLVGFALCVFLDAEYAVFIIGIMAIILNSTKKPRN